MAYRIACIYEQNAVSQTTVRLEVCNEGNSLQITPFLRKVCVADLMRDVNDQTRQFAALLNNLGFERQPFKLGHETVAISTVAELIESNSYSFVQNGSNRSLKRGHAAIIRQKITINSGSLLGGALYITNPADWKNGIEVRLRYENAISEVYPAFSDFPVATTNGMYIHRDAKAEQTLLSSLSSGSLSETGMLTLNEYDVSFLKELESRGWVVLYAKNSGKTSKVHFHRAPSGIDWFSTSYEEDDDINAKLLEAYLRGRHFQEGRDTTFFFSKNDVAKQDCTTFAESYISDKTLVERYKEVTLSAQEEQSIRHSIEQGFDATLRDYQWEGVMWLAKMRKKGCGCILADEMGLGKTIQVLAHLFSTDNAHTLIVVPTSLVSNWCAEITKFIPAWENELSLNRRIPEANKKLHIVSYELLRRNIAHYKAIHYDSLVLDEAQVLKNDSTQRHKVISQLDFSHSIVMTGTPIENAVDDVWSYFYILMPGMRALHDRLKRLTEGSTQTDAFLQVSSKLLNPFILRRTKQEFLKELPPCIECNVYITLDEEESSVYNSVYKVFRKAMKDGTSGRVTSIALEALLRLRQTCVSVNLLPRTLYKGGRKMSTKMQLVLSQIQNLEKDDKLIVFSQFVQALEELEGYLNEMGIPYVSLYGTTSDRGTPVNTFQRNQNVRIFLSSIKAGGVGLNLTAADYVLLLDDWWNPAVEAQAFSRAHRIGQKRTVEVTRLICKDTVEEKILALQQSKQQTADVFNLSSGKLTNEELLILLS